VAGQSHIALGGAGAAGEVLLEPSAPLAVADLGLRLDDQLAGLDGVLECGPGGRCAKLVLAVDAGGKGQGYLGAHAAPRLTFVVQRARHERPVTSRPLLAQIRDRAR
jgi:hypothetical protein